MNWTYTKSHYEAGFPVVDHWEGSHGFWITAITYRIWSPNTQTYGKDFKRYSLNNGDHELGVYDTLEEAQNAAEPAHVVNEAPEDAPVCYWCSGSHPGQICENAPYYVESKVNP